MDRLVRETDIDKLERLLQNVTFSQLEKADLKKFNDKNIIKLFKLGQLTTEYLLYTQGVAENIAQERQTEYEHRYSEAAKLQEQLKDNQRRINQLREKDGEHKQTLKTYEALLTNQMPKSAKGADLMVGGINPKCKFCMKVFATQDFLRAHYKKRHSEQYMSEGLENQENIQLMANLLQAADLAKQDLNLHGYQHKDDTEDLMAKLREEVVDKFESDLAKLTSEIETLRRTNHVEETSVIITLNEVKTKEEERIQQAKDAQVQYQAMIEKLKDQFQNEVKSHQASIVSEVQRKLNLAFDAQDVRDTREEELATEIRNKIEKEFAEQFETRFNQLEEQLKEKERIAEENKQLLIILQEQQKELGSKQVPLPAPSEDPVMKAKKEESEQLIAELRKSQVDELQRLEALLLAEKELRQSKELQLELQAKARLEQDRVDRLRLIDEAVNAAKASSEAALAALKQEVLETKTPEKKNKDKKKPKAAIKDKHIVADSPAEEDSDDGEFFVRDSKPSKKPQPEIESFMSISKQHEKRGFGDKAVKSGKETKSSAFEDDDDPMPVTQKPKVKEPAKPFVKQEEGVPPKFSEEEQKVKPLDSARQKKLDEIKEVADEEDKEATFSDPLKYLKAKDLALEMAESAACKELRVLIASLESQLLGKQPRHYFMANRYKSDDGSTMPITTIFKHSQKDIERGRALFVKQKTQQAIAENLRGFGFSNRAAVGTNIVDTLSKAECRHVTEETVKRARADAVRYAEVDRLVQQMIGERDKKKNVKDSADSERDPVSAEASARIASEEKSKEKPPLAQPAKRASEKKVVEEPPQPKPPSQRKPSGQTEAAKPPSAKDGDDWSDNELPVKKPPKPAEIKPPVREPAQKPPIQPASRNPSGTIQTEVPDKSPKDSTEPKRKSVEEVKQPAKKEEQKAEEDWALEDEEATPKNKVEESTFREEKPINAAGSSSGNSKQSSEATALKLKEEEGKISDQAAKQKELDEEQERKKDEEIKAKIQEQIRRQKQLEEEQSKKAEEEANALAKAAALSKAAQEQEALLKLQQQTITVDQSTHPSAPISELLPKVLILGDSAIGKSSFIQQYVEGHSKRVEITSTKALPRYYSASVDEMAFQFVDIHADAIDPQSLLQDPLCVLLCYNLNSEASLTSLKTKWMPLLLKNLNKAALKLGIILVGLSFQDEECSFQHKVALFARGFSLNGKTVVYSLKNASEGHKQLKDLLKLALEKVSAQGNQSFTTESNAPPESSRSKSVLMLPTEESIIKVKASVVEQSGEIEDIIKAAAAVSAQTKKEEAIPLKKEEAKQPEVKPPVDDDYDEDFE